MQRFLLLFIGVVLLSLTAAAQNENALYEKGYYGNIDYFFEKNGYFPPKATIEYKLERPTKIKLEN